MTFSVPRGNFTREVYRALARDDRDQAEDRVTPATAAFGSRDGLTSQRMSSIAKTSFRSVRVAGFRGPRDEDVNDPSRERVHDLRPIEARCTPVTRTGRSSRFASEFRQ